MKKKIVSIIMIATLAVSITACGGKSEQVPDKTVDNSSGYDSETQELVESITAETAEYQGICGADAKWYYKDNVLVIKGTGEITDNPWSDEDEMSVNWLIIDEGITSISCSEAFKGYGVTSDLAKVILPSTLTTIAEGCFYSCSVLTNINIPDSVTSIGSEAFFECESITSINIPDGVTSIGSSAFLGCSSLAEIDIPDSVTEIDYQTFSGCSSLTDINIPDGVTVIGRYAFSGCSSLTDINIPDGVTHIGEGAFSGCSSITNINIPSSVSAIGEFAFSCDSLSNIDVDDSNAYFDDRDNCNAIINSNTNVLIRGCDSTVIPDSVTGIGAGAFSGCESMTSVQIPDGVTSIGASAFSGCESITSIRIPGSVTSIEENAFHRCSSLLSIVVDDNNEYYDSRESCNAIIETNTNTLIQGSNSTVIPDSVTSIGDDAFFECKHLTSINIPESVTYIGCHAFVNCSSLTNITIAESIRIGEGAFHGCDSLPEETKEYILSIDDNAFFLEGP